MANEAHAVDLQRRVGAWISEGLAIAKAMGEELGSMNDWFLVVLREQEGVEAMRGGGVLQAAKEGRLRMAVKIPLAHGLPFDRGLREGPEKATIRKNFTLGK
jgi:hypothetical protein